MSTSWWVEWYL